MFYIKQGFEKMVGSEKPKFLNRDRSRRQSYDAIIILGNGIRKETLPKNGLLIDGVSYIPSMDAYSRLVAGAEAWRKGLTPRLLLSGGASEKGSGVTEAQVYAYFLTEVGYEIDGERIKLPVESLELENRSHDTSTNINYCALIISQNNWNKVAVLTNNSHLGRVIPITKTLLKGPKTIGFLAAEDLLNPELAEKYPSSKRTATSALMELWTKILDPKGTVLRKVAERTRR